MRMQHKEYSLPENGFVLLVDKPYGWSSFQVVNFFKWRLKKLCRQKKVKIGHAGTLDPLATGLLILCVGKQTKNIVSFQEQAKEYKGSLNLGYHSPSYDLEQPITKQDYALHSTEEIAAAFESLEGEYEQSAPMFSAKKFKGRRAFKLAREGKEVELKKNKISVSAFDITEMRGSAIDFDIHCSKGTYVRSAVRDVGHALKTEAVMTALRRTKIGEHDIKDALQHPDWAKSVIPHLVEKEEESSKN